MGCRAGSARVIADSASVKVSLSRREDAQVALCQVDGRRWLTLSGTADVTENPERVADAVARYTQRYRKPRANPRRVAIELLVSRMSGSRDIIR